jgi:carbonic anhydrase
VILTRQTDTPPTSRSTDTARRALLRAAISGTAATAGVGLAGSGASASTHTPEPGPRPTTPAQALEELAAGNRRWRTFKERHPDETQAVRRELVTVQHPFALILGCIDSRVPPELAFDQGLGDLMTVRSAGQVLDEAVLGSVAYGVLELGIPLVMVLGHQSCGAVTAAVQADRTGDPLPAHIQYVADQIQPAIDHEQQGDARIDATVDANVALIRERLGAEPDLAARVASGELAIVGARYELTTQLVHTLA